ncbi:MAG: DUF4199 domain-containing protein [Bacteroidia bacterium]
MKITMNVKMGLAAGLIICGAWFSFYKSMGPYSWNIDMYRYFITLLSLLLGIFISVILERRSRGGFIEFKDALKCGVLYTIVVTIIICLFNSLYYHVIAVDAIDFFVADQKKQMIIAKLEEADMNRNLEYVRSYFGSFRLFGTTVFQGIIISLLAAAILRRKDPGTVAA